MASDEDAPNAVLGRKEVEIPRCPVHSVVVYPDRAEVTRLVTVELPKGNCEVVLKSLSKSLDKESIRVDGIGHATITEVSYQEVAVTQEEDRCATASKAVADLEHRLNDLVSNLKTLDQRIARTSDQRGFLTDYSNKLISAGAQAKTVDLLDDSIVDGVFSFLETFEEKYFSLSVSAFEADEEKKELEQKIEEVRQILKVLKPNAQQPTEPVKQPVIGVLLKVNEADATIQLLVSYLVSSASWSPKYDLRVSSQERKMEVRYFGMVQQNTGENWIDTKLSLSTATPSIGGSAPTLETVRLTLVPGAKPQLKGSRHSSFRMGRIALYDSLSAAPYEEDGLAHSEMLQQCVVREAQVSTGLSSSVFQIPTPASIPCDKSGHKVAVATIHLDPTFEYDTVPKQIQHAFLRAKVTNGSSYPLLAGPANVFLDQAYVTVTHLPAVAPNEDFSCSLGVDPSVKVVYKPLKRFRETGGLISKVVTYTYQQVTEITNTREETATVTFTDQVPRSQEEKLKVNLVSPLLPKQRPGATPTNPRLNSDHNLEWRLELGAGETRCLTVHYTIEYPSSQEVEGL